MVERLLSTTEIAFMAGVRKSSVSMWKKRHEDFPKPVTHKLYNANEVEAWLEQRKRNSAGN